MADRWVFYKRSKAPFNRVVEILNKGGIVNVRQKKEKGKGTWMLERIVRGIDD